MRNRFATPHVSRPTLPYVGLGILFAAALLYQVPYSYDLWRDRNMAAPLISPATASAKLESVKPDAEQLGLHKGDILLAVNGQPYAGTAVLAEAYAKAFPGGHIEVTVRSGAETHRVLLPITLAAKPLGSKVFDLLLNIVMPFGCLLLGFWVAFVRPRDRLAWIVLGLLLCFSQILGTYEIEAWGRGLREAAMIYRMTLAASWPIFMFLFGFFFPEPFPFLAGPSAWKRVIPLVVIIPPIVQVVELVRVSVLEMTDYAAARAVLDHFHPVEIPLRIYLYCMVGFGFFGSIFTKSAMPIPPDASRRLQLLYWGATVAFTPLFVMSVVASARGQLVNEMFPQWLTGVALFLLVMFPLTLAYVIVVQRAMDVRVVLRQGLQYGLATTGIRVLQYVAIAVVIAMAFALGGHSNQIVKMIVIAVAISIGLSIPRFAERLRQWTDRRFFREAYNAETVLSELSDNVRSMMEAGPLIETVTARISDTLHVPQVAVLLSAGETYKLAYAAGYSPNPDVAFAPGAVTIRVLREEKGPARVYFDDPNSWLYRGEVSDDDRAKLSQLQAELLLPLSAQEKLLGFISLGPKRSEEPYSGADLRLLKSVAAQTGLALENARLMSAIADEVAQRERLNREVEIAREVQERLFPQNFPPIAGIDYAGACRPALGVGGDYYDFLALPGGQLGIAIGDVSGKGIAAALMMASLQASLRGEATRAPQNLAALISNVNRLVYEASSANRYATFFYAQYNPSTRQLVYVNAGHNPPMLFHCAEGRWNLCRLETGGTVVGLLESFPYQQAALTIASGDTLIAFTDGISEAMNAADEEWGEERMIETVKSCEGMNPAEIITCIMQAADEFVAGASQHDDMTLVVVRAE